MSILKANHLLITLIAILISVSVVVAQDNEDSLVTVSWSPDGTMIAIGGTNSIAQVWEVNTNQLVLDFSQVGTSETLRDIDWSPDGQQVAVIRGQSVYVINVSSGETIATLSATDNLAVLDWSPDGKWLVTGSWPGLLRLWDMTSFQISQTLNVGETYTLEWSPDGTYIAVGGLPGLRLFPADLQVEEADLNNFNLYMEIDVSGVSWSSDGNSLAFADIRGQIHIVDVNSRREVISFDGFINPISSAYSLSWSADNQFLAAYSYDGRVKVWNSTTGTTQEEYMGNSNQVTFNFGFSPFGGRLAFGGDATQSSLNSPPSETSDSVLANGAVQIVVPAPSPERLQSIAGLCGAAPTIEQALTADIAAANYESVIEQVNALPTDALPPGCAADLLAMAEVLASR